MNGRWTLASIEHGRPGEINMRVSVVYLAAILAASLSHAEARPEPEHGQLAAVHSGACLAGADRPAVVDCGAAPVLVITPVAGRGDQVTIRDEERGVCVTSSRDGHFGWDACDPRRDDQRWIFFVPREKALPSEASRGKMLKAVASGRCLMSNRDGRFGATDCTAKWGDHYWHLQPKVERPRAIARDCGTTADDAGCEEERGGHVALARDEWQGLLATLKATWSDVSKRRMLESSARTNYFTAAQLVTALALFRSEPEEVAVVRALAPHVIDPRRAIAFGAHMRSPTERERLVKLLSDAAVAVEKLRDPPPPATPVAPPPPPKPAPARPVKHATCRPQPACGLACPSGAYAHDENGCSLCACAPSFSPSQLPTRR
jgi:hypothetical protein